MDQIFSALPSSTHGTCRRLLVGLLTRGMVSSGRHWEALTQWPGVATWALAAEGARRVEAGATMAAGPTHPALIYITPAAAALVAGWAGAQVAAIGAH